MRLASTAAEFVIARRRAHGHFREGEHTDCVYDHLRRIAKSGLFVEVEGCGIET